MHQIILVRLDSANLNDTERMFCDRMTAVKDLNSRWDGEQDLYWRAQIQYVGQENSSFPRSECGDNEIPT